MKEHFLAYIQNSITNYWDSPALTNLSGESFTYGEVAREIARLQILFDKIGIKKGDKVAICAKNSARWGIAFLAASSHETVVVPLLNDFHADSVQNLTDHSESKLLFTDLDIWSKLDISQMPALMTVINVADFKFLYNKDDSMAFAFDNIDELFKAKYPNFSASDINFPTDNFDDLALINYTSGTTSDPKGVMLTYKSISSNIQFGLFG
ncbi:MAG: AMP-binding protein, partial [Bacteroidales bacterium]